MFADPDTYILYLTAVVSPDLMLEEQQRVSPRMVFDQYIGHKETLCAPDWIKWTAGEMYEMWRRRDYVMNVLARLAADRRNSVQVSARYPCMSILN